MSNEPTRRDVLRSALWGSLGAALVGGCVDRPRTSGGAKRLLVILKPCGTQPESYDCEGGETDFTLSPILEPFAPFREQLLIAEGLDIRKKENTPGQAHGNGMVTLMTGGITIKDPRFRAVVAERSSIDQLLAASAPFAGATPIPSVQLAADVRSDRDEIFTRVLSYGGRAQPIPPEHRPDLAYARLFGLAGGAELSPQDFQAVRHRRKSILDFSKASIGRLQSALGAEENRHLEAHLQAIREAENVIAKANSCAVDPELIAGAQGLGLQTSDLLHGDIGLAHLNLIRTAFQCDLTRVATFLWAAGNSHVNFSGLIDGVEDMAHHAITHQGSNRVADETAIHRWYNERMAEFLVGMRDTMDSEGQSLLETTLIVIASEIRLGKHTFDNIPIQLIGGGLRGGRKIQFGGRSTNDLWLAIAKHMGSEGLSFGDPDRAGGPLTGIFS